MYYIVFKASLEESWQPLKHEQEDARQTFVSQKEAADAAAELAKEGHDLFVAVNEEGRYVSLIFAGHNPYTFDDTEITS
jgi:hypothetical protein